MFSLFVRNLFFAILQPGVVAFLIPYLILGERIGAIWPENYLFRHITGIILFFTGTIVLVACIFSFAVKGKGTLSPADPTKKLVTSGLYLYSRNPMYLGVMLMLIGEALFFSLIGLWIYSLLVFVAFHVFTVCVEEPRLRRDFGEEYSLYCRNTKRWL